MRNFLKTILKATFVVAAAVALIVYCKSIFGEQYTEKTEGKKTSIHWEYVNLREDHTQNSDIITVLHEGNNVTLTGYSYEYLSAEDIPQESWLKVITEDGQTGWIVSDSIQW